MVARGGRQKRGSVTGRTERRLLEQERQFRELTEHRRDGVLVVDEDRRILYANAAAAALLGAGERPLVGREFQWPTTPGGTRLIDVFRPEGGSRSLEVRSRPSIWDGRPVEVVTVEDGWHIDTRASLDRAQRIAHLGSWELDLVHGTRFWSDEMFRLLGLDPAAVAAEWSLFLDSVYPDDRDKVAAAQERAIQSGGALDIEHRVVLPDGRVRWVHELGEIERDRDGRAVRLVGTMRDVTERHMASALLSWETWIFETIIAGGELSAVLERIARGLEGILAGAMVSIFLVDDENGRLCSACAPSLPPALRSAVDGLPISPEIGFCGTAAAKGKQVIVEDIEVDTRWEQLQQFAKAHALRACWSAPVYDSVGQVIATVSLFFQTPRRPEVFDLPFLDRAAHLVGIACERERTTRALRESEARFRGMFQQSGMGIAIADLEGKFLEVNAAYADMLGYGIEEILSLNLWSIIHPADVPTNERLLRELLSGDIDSGIMEIRSLAKDGRIVPVRVSVSLIRDFEGNPVSVVGMVEDITDRVLAEDRGRRHSEQLMLTLESISDAFYTLDHAWSFTYLNPMAEVLLERSYEELIGKCVWDEFPAVVGSQIEQEYRRAVKGQITVAFETYYPPLDRWFGIRAYPTSEGLAVYFQDSTEGRRARAALQEHEERFRLVSRATRDAVWDWDYARSTVWWNEGFTALFGHARVDEPMPLSSWSDHVHPDDLERTKAAILAAAEGDVSEWGGEYRFRRSDGSWARVMDRGHIVRDGSGRAVRMVGAMTDISELTQATERLEQQAELLDKANDAILVRDLEQRVVYWNRSAERLYGWTRTEAIGRPVEELLYDDPESFRQATQVVLREGEWRGELRQRAKDGREIIVDGRWTLVRDDAGRPKAILAINADQTERRRLEAQYLRAQRLESIGTLAGGIAHDLNNMLSPIMLSLSMLKMEERNPDRLELLSTIEESAKRGADMVRQVLSFARGVEGRRDNVPIGALIKGVQKLANETFLKTVQVRTEIATDLWPVAGDPTQLHQVLLNLCVNARDAMPDGGRLVLSAENIEVDSHYAGLVPGATPGSYVVIQVEDTGHGMSPEVLDRIFDPFFTTKDPGKGTGLGLSSSLAIVRSHGGFIRVYSEPGRGSTFRIYLPADLEATVSEVADETGDLLRGQGQLVLVVDDEAAVRQITRQTLEAFGYRALVAADGAEAVALYAARKDEIDVVLTDMMMPIMDGPATIQVLRRMNPDVRIIAASGFSADNRAARAGEAGVRHFLPKPFTAESLLQTLREVLAEPTKG